MDASTIIAIVGAVAGLTGSVVAIVRGSTHLDNLDRQIAILEKLEPTSDAATSINNAIKNTASRHEKLTEDRTRTFSNRAIFVLCLLCAAALMVLATLSVSTKHSVELKEYSLGTIAAVFSGIGLIGLIKSLRN
jgi:hypothetical protein